MPRLRIGLMTGKASLACLAAALALACCAPARAQEDEEPGPKINEFVYFDTMPEAISKVEPVYPQAARDAGIWGTVAVEVLVGTDGRVRQAVVVGSIPALDDAALAAVRAWTFKPAMNQGNPVAVWVQIPIRFHLDHGAETKAIPKNRPQGPTPIGRTFAALIADTTGAPPGEEEATEPPDVVKRVPPVYPPAALAARVSGTVTVVARVGADGHVRGARVARSISALDSAAVAAVRQWVFEPATGADTLAERRVRVPVRFAIPGAPETKAVAVARPARRDSVVRAHESAPAPAPPQTRSALPAWPPEWSRGDTRVLPAEAMPYDSLPYVVAATDLVTPEGADEHGGLVVVRALVRSDGTVGQAKIAQSVPGLDQPALEAVRRWRFEPAMRKGRPMALRVYIPLRFHRR